MFFSGLCIGSSLLDPSLLEFLPLFLFRGRFWLELLKTSFILAKALPSWIEWERRYHIGSSIVQKRAKRSIWPQVKSKRTYEWEMKCFHIYRDCQSQGPGTSTTISPSKMLNPSRNSPFGYKTWVGKVVPLFLFIVSFRNGYVAIVSFRITFRMYGLYLFFNSQIQGWKKILFHYVLYQKFHLNLDEMVWVMRFYTFKLVV